MGGSLGDLVKNVITFGAHGQQEAQKEAQRAQRRAEMEARRIAAEKKPMEESATLGMNTEVGAVDPLSSLNLLVDPEKRKRSTGLGASMASTGLGFGN